MLETQHREAQKLFRQGEKVRKDPDRLREIVEQCCDALLQHAQLEEEHFYPVMHESARDADMIDEAEVEHASARQLIEQLQGGELDEERYAATYKVLAEYTNHHIKEEEKEIFPRARRMRADWTPLLEALQASAGEQGAEATGGSRGAMGEGAAADGSTRTGGREGELLGGSMLGGEGEQGEGGTRGRRAGARRTSRTRGEGEEGGTEEGTAHGREQDQDEQTARGTRSGSR
jgi:hemerythrin superfamily protein